MDCQRTAEFRASQSRYRHDPIKGHWQVVNWIIQYLLKTIEVGPVFEQDDTCD